MVGEMPNNCKLQIRVADSTNLEHLQIMQGQKGRAALPAAYTLTRTPTQAKIIPRGVLNHMETELFIALIFGMVHSDAYDEHRACNPFNFQLFDLQRVHLTENREEMPYSALDLTGGKKIEGYNTLFFGSGDMNCRHSLHVPV